MSVSVTIRPHTVVDKRSGREETYDQYQILIGQRVVGYLGKRAHCVPKLVVRDLSEECLAAIEAAAAEALKSEIRPGAVVQQPVGATAAVRRRPAAAPADEGVAPAALEAAERAERAAQDRGEKRPQ